MKSAYEYTYQLVIPRVVGHPFDNKPIVIIERVDVFEYKNLSAPGKQFEDLATESYFVFTINLN